MAEDGKDWNGLEMMILKRLANFFKIHDGDVAPLRACNSEMRAMLCSLLWGSDNEKNLSILTGMDCVLSNLPILYGDVHLISDDCFLTDSCTACHDLRKTL